MHLRVAARLEELEHLGAEDDGCPGRRRLRPTSKGERSTISGMRGADARSPARAAGTADQVEAAGVDRGLGRGGVEERDVARGERLHGGSRRGSVPAGRPPQSSSASATKP